MRWSLATVLWPRFSPRASNSHKCFVSGMLRAPRKFLTFLQLFPKTSGRTAPSVRERRQLAASLFGNLVELPRCLAKFAWPGNAVANSFS
jgi:hypothetical protein